MNTVNLESKIIALPKLEDDRGNLSFLQNFDQIPFEIKRLYWIYDVPSGESRGGHAYYKLEELIIALSGSFDVVADDGTKKEKYHLNSSNQGCYIPMLFWREIKNFSTNAIALIVSSREYNANDYIYDYNVFKNITK